MKLTKILLGINVILSFNFAISQNVGIGTATPDASAKLHVSSTNSGILVPNITLTDVSAAAPVTAPATGLLIWNTNASVTGGSGAGYYYWSGSSWTKLASEPISLHTNGDVKHSFVASDHSGWVQLDGRLLSSLTATQQAAATALGFVGNLPDATNRVLKQNGAVNTTGGSNTTTIAQVNLPNVNLSGTAASDGIHSHSATSGYAGAHYHSFIDYGYSNNGTFADDIDDDPGLGGGTTFTMDDNDLNFTNYAASHVHSISVGNSDSHTHTVSVSTGGSGAALNVENPYLTTNVFVYLGL